MTQTATMERARKRLEEERARLLRLRDGIHEETGPEEPESSELQEVSAVDQHPADLGTEVFEREKDLSIVQRFETELSDIEDALTRIDDGTYGRCEVCDRPIGEARLEAIPHARFCVEDQANAERT